MLDVLYGTLPYAYCLSDPKIIYSLMKKEDPFGIRPKTRKASTPRNDYDHIYNDLCQRLEPIRASTPPGIIKVELDQLCDLWSTMVGCWRFRVYKRPSANLVLFRLKTLNKLEICGTLVKYLHSSVSGFQRLEDIVRFAADQKNISEHLESSTDRSLGALAIANRRIRNKIDNDLRKHDDGIMLSQRALGSSQGMPSFMTGLPVQMASLPDGPPLGGDESDSEADADVA
ncbi:hypothetical protein SISSUDRAFT_675589 [Sistotremastrum suecicum HHB10207 ss-3]|uniref:Uncharacterized protein n=1 Tax=Sistotremastrum suecicum HHB10207 ss-3 TaxID=1314776 RepID=A0A165WZX8_9AGAM|nr:hypothetical protein SISSUDRAFT_675589 [Sistotremastrum suecicum HHB10207 ss-3]